jgi:hypothetical protein
VNWRQGCRKITLVAGGAASVDLHRALITALILGGDSLFPCDPPERLAALDDNVRRYRGTGVWTIKPARHTTV